MLKILQYLSDFVALLYPNRCAACGAGLLGGEHVLCQQCQRQIPKTNYWQHADNPIAQMFHKRLPVRNACAFFHFYDGSQWRSMLHKLKYCRQPQIGVAMGEKFGMELAASDFFSSNSVLVPVPLHPKRERQRGYNQSERIACGMAAAMGIPVIEHALVRTRNNKTQTQMSRSERRENVLNIFAAGRNIERLRGMHVIVVDDVITTGATLESLIKTLLNNVNCMVSVAALAAADSSPQI
jgi:ComF family protein